MDNEIIEQAEQVIEQPAEESAVAEQSGGAEIAALRQEVAELRLRLALMTGGAAPEKLDEAVKLAGGIMGAESGCPENAANEVLNEYPHLKLTKRTIPQFSAESRGSADGFAAIRSIFAKR